jgi:hypothetical protein
MGAFYLSCDELDFGLKWQGWKARTRSKVNFAQTALRVAGCASEAKPPLFLWQTEFAIEIRQAQMDV